jgi:hypothetical protein
MFWRRRDELNHDNTGLVDREVVERPMPVTVRGGISLWAVLTGMMTALGVLLLGAAITGGIAAATDTTGAALTSDASNGWTWTALAFCAAVFIAFVWGGYTAGRMARGMGMLNGFLVPLFTLIVGAGVVALVDALGTTTSWTIPAFGTWNIPYEGSSMTTRGTVTGIVALALMFVGGMLGGIRGVTWHRRLEDPAIGHPAGRRTLAA